MTAVEKIKSEFYSYAKPFTGFSEESKWTISEEDFEKLIEKAKEMEKEQMEITWNNAIDAQLKDKWDSYDDFHKTTFKSE